MWQTRKSWSRQRRVVAKAEWTKGEANPRFIVTSLRRDQGGQVSLRESLLRPRRYGKPDQGVPARPLCGPHLDRHHAGQSAAAMVRLDVLLCALRRIGLHGTTLANATCGTIRLKLLKVGALVRIKCSPHQIRHGIGLSRRPNLGYRRRPARARCSCARLSSLTRLAARAIAAAPPLTNRDHSPLLPQLRKHPRSTASPGATTAHVPEKFHQPSRKVHPLCEDSVRNPG
jgi:hypothetical protein